MHAGKTQMAVGRDTYVWGKGRCWEAYYDCLEHASSLGCGVGAFQGLGFVETLLDERIVTLDMFDNVHAGKRVRILFRFFNFYGSQCPFGWAPSTPPEAANQRKPQEIK